MDEDLLGRGAGDPDMYGYPGETGKELLNKIDAGYVGVVRAKIRFSREVGLTGSDLELETVDGDHLRIDEQGWDFNNEGDTNDEV